MAGPRVQFEADVIAQLPHCSAIELAYILNAAERAHAGAVPGAAAPFLVGGPFVQGNFENDLNNGQAGPIQRVVTGNTGPRGAAGVAAELLQADVNRLIPEIKKQKLIQDIIADLPNRNPVQLRALETSAAVQAVNATWVNGQFEGVLNGAGGMGPGVMARNPGTPNLPDPDIAILLPEIRQEQQNQFVADIQLDLLNHSALGLTGVQLNAIYQATQVGGGGAYVLGTFERALKNQGMAATRALHKKVKLPHNPAVVNLIPDIQRARQEELMQEIKNNLAGLTPGQLAAIDQPASYAGGPVNATGGPLENALSLNGMAAIINQGSRQGIPHFTNVQVANLKQHVEQERQARLHAALQAGITVAIGAPGALNATELRYILQKAQTAQAGAPYVPGTFEIDLNNVAASPAIQAIVGHVDHAGVQLQVGIGANNIGALIPIIQNQQRLELDAAIQATFRGAPGPGPFLTFTQLDLIEQAVTNAGAAAAAPAGYPAGSFERALNNAHSGLQAIIAARPGVELTSLQIANLAGPIGNAKNLLRTTLSNAIIAGLAGRSPNQLNAILNAALAAQAAAAAAGYVPGTFENDLRLPSANMRVIIDAHSGVQLTPADIRNLIGQIRYLQFISREDVKAMPELIKVFEGTVGGLGPNPMIKNALIAHWSNPANLPPDAAAITQLRNDLDVAVDAKAARGALRTAFNAGANVPLNAANLKIAGAIQNNGNENQLRGEARYEKVMIDNKDVLAPMFTVKNFLTGVAVRADLVAHWGQFGNPIPPPVAGAPAGTPHSPGLTPFRDALEALAPNDVANAQGAFALIRGGANFLAKANGFIGSAGDANRVRSEGRASKFAVNVPAAKAHRVDAFRAIVDFKNAAAAAKASDQPSLDTLVNSIHALQGVLEPNNELQTSLTELLNKLGNPVPGAPAIAPATAVAVKEFKEALSDAKTSYAKVRSSVRHIIDEKTSYTDRGPQAFERMAQKYHDDAERRLGSISPEDEQETDHILKACKKMKDALDIAEGELRDRKRVIKDPNEFVWNRKSKKADVNDRLAIIASSRTILNDTIAMIQKGKALGQVQNVNYYSDDADILLPPNNTVADINAKIQAFNAGLPVGAGGGGPALVAGGGNIQTTTRFDGGALRVNYNTLQTYNNPAIAPGAPGVLTNAKVLSVQGVINGQYQMQLHYKPDDIKKMPFDELVKYAAIEVENFYAGLPDKSTKMTIKGNMEPELAEAIYAYCLTKHYPLPGSRVSLPQRTPASRDNYLQNFKTTLERNANTIFPHVAGLAMPGETKKKLEEVTQTSHRHIPRGPN